MNITAITETGVGADRINEIALELVSALEAKAIERPEDITETLTNFEILKSRVKNLKLNKKTMQALMKARIFQLYEIGLFLIDNIDKHPGVASPDLVTPGCLHAIGLSFSQSANYQKIASLPLKQVETELDLLLKEDKPITEKYFINMANPVKKKSNFKKQFEKQKTAESAQGKTQLSTDSGATTPEATRVEATKATQRDATETTTQETPRDTGHMEGRAKRDERYLKGKKFQTDIKHIIREMEWHLRKAKKVNDRFTPQNLSFYLKVLEDKIIPFMESWIGDMTECDHCYGTGRVSVNGHELVCDRCFKGRTGKIKIDGT